MLSARNWEEVLDDLEDRVEGHGATLAGGPPLEAYELPEGLGSLPPELLERALRIVIRQREVEETIVTRMALLRTLASIREVNAPVPAPLYLDKSA